MYKGYKIRIYPTKAQAEMIWKHINATRFVWNHLLELDQERFKNNEKHLHKFDMINHVAEFKNAPGNEWLKEVSHVSLQKVCFDMEIAFNRFFKGLSGFPKFKSSKSKDSYCVCENRFYFTETHVQIQKLGKVKYKTDLDIPIGKDVVKFTKVSISYENNKYMLSFNILCENKNKNTQLNDYFMGIDMGLKEFATVAYGENTLVFHNINKSKYIKDIEDRLKFYQKEINRKYEASYKKYGRYVKSKNIKNLEKIIKRISTKLSNIRKNYIHQITHQLVELKPCRVTVETLDIKYMLQTKPFSNSVSTACIAEFIRQMEYKCKNAGIEFVKAPQYFPSSKTCSNCGSIKTDLKLSDRIYKCEHCGLSIDRDINAAINLMKYTS